MIRVVGLQKFGCRQTEFSTPPDTVAVGNGSRRIGGPIGAIGAAAECCDARPTFQFQSRNEAELLISTPFPRAANRHRRLASADDASGGLQGLPGGDDFLGDGTVKGGDVPSFSGNP